jgi:hypothetical protein
MFMNPNPPSGSHPRRWPRWATPAAALGAFGTTLVIWFEEIVALATEFIGVIFLPILASIIYLFNFYVFKSAMPKADDIKK